MPMMKSILAHMSDNGQHVVRLRVAVQMAKRFGAHLNVVFAKPDADYPAGSIGRAMSMHYLEEARREANERLDAIKAEVDRTCGGLPSWERHEHFGDVVKIMSRFAHLADLVVVEQPAPDDPDESFMEDLSDHLVVSAGCPMLLLPAGWPEGKIGTRVLVAWKNSREASLAVRGSLDFLRDAEQVLVLAAEDAEPAGHGSDLVAYLGHHGVDATVIGTSGGDGAEFLKIARNHRCDLLVMGAYAHSRFREMLLGGSTAYILRHTTLPVLMRH